MAQNFWTWLMAQRERQDVVGDLAKDAARTKLADKTQRGVRAALGAFDPPEWARAGYEKAVTEFRAANRRPVNPAFNFDDYCRQHGMAPRTDGK